ncbi:MAG TPA: tyrosine-type recombinase/integrase, partial [Tepidisphaeraceae bacterium]|nr:tyrosine-type recombinase/integrase [Tepidisphaeraceae bacterium]
MASEWTFPRSVPDGVSVYKPKGASERARWCIAYRLGRGTKRIVERVSADVAATYRRVLAVAKDVQAGHVDPRAAQLAAAGRKPLVRTAEGTGLGDCHLADFERDLLAKGNTKKHAYEVRRHCQWIIEQAGAIAPSDLLPAPVRAALEKLREAGALGTRKNGGARQTQKHYLRHIKQFSKWLKKNNRVGENLLADMEGYNVRTDRRHDHQDLGDEGYRLLLESTRTAPDAFGMTGEERAMLYETALETGFRANECRTLTPARCKLDRLHPVIVVLAGYSKHRREDTQPVRPEFAARLRKFLDGRPADKPIWPLPDEAVDVLRPDVERAGLDYRDADGRFADFHALRHTFICRLVRAGVNPKECQVLARHASIQQTMDYYAHLKLHDTAAAVRKLGAADVKMGKEQQQATGTDGKNVAQTERPNVRECPDMSTRATVVAGGRNRASDTGGGGLPAEGVMQLAGVEPATFGSVDRPDKRHKRGTSKGMGDGGGDERSAISSAIDRTLPDAERVRRALQRIDEQA